MTRPVYNESSQSTCASGLEALRGACLGIPPGAEPMSYYRLLDVRLYEQDEQTINHAAERQVARVRKRAGSASAGDVAALESEIETARQVLLDAHSRDNYDRQLCASLFPPVIERPCPPPGPAAPGANGTHAHDGRLGVESAPRGVSLWQRVAGSLKRALGG